MVNEVAVKLSLPPTIKLHPVVHVSQLIPFVAEQRWGARGKPPAPVLGNEGFASYLWWRAFWPQTGNGAGQDGTPRISVLGQVAGLPSVAAHLGA